MKHYRPARGMALLEDAGLSPEQLALVKSRFTMQQTVALVKAVRKHMVGGQHLKYVMNVDSSHP